MRIFLLDSGAAGARAQTAGLAAAVAELCGGAEISACEIRGLALAGIFPRIVSHASRVFRFASLPAGSKLSDSEISKISESKLSDSEVSQISKSKVSKTADPESGICNSEISENDMVIACGHRTAAAALEMRRRGAFVVFVQKPPVSSVAFDAVICPMHDEVRGENVLPILGSAGGARPAELQKRRDSALSKFAHIPAPRTALLIGGDSRAYRMTPDFCRELAESVVRAVRDGGGGITATTSRRTNSECTAVLKKMLADGNNFLYSGEGENPYPDILAAADRFVVSADSVNMLSEAAAAAKPLFFAEPPLRSAFSARTARKFRRFHSELESRGIARKWAGDFADCAEWTQPGLDETARAAEFVWRRYRARKNNRDEKR